MADSTPSGGASRWPPLVALLAFVVVVAWMAQIAMSSAGKSISWTELKQHVEQGEVEEITFDRGYVRAKLTATDDQKAATVVQAVRVDADPTFIGLLEEKGVPYRAVPTTDCQGLMLTLVLVPMLLLTVMWVFLARRDPQGRGVAAFSRSSAKLVPEEGTGVTFEDVAGVDEAAEELREIVQFLQTPEKFTVLGGRPPKGVLLVGPPGTGKTLLARAVAGEAGVPFFSISGSDFVEMFVGVGAARVRDLFKTAQEHAPCIIFVDELDAVGKARGVGPVGNEEREQTLNQLLVEMDGFDNRGGIIVMAATNRPETLDPALLRPGRFDRQVLVDRPDRKGRVAILRVHARTLVLDPAMDLELIAQLTPGFAGSDLANALNEGALLAARRGASSVGMEDVKEAIERIIGGLKKNRRLSLNERKTVAFHECGHAIAAAASPGADPVSKISIIPRGIAALGYTMQMPLEDRYLMSKAELLNRLTVLYGGRAAEEIVFGDVTTGAHNDIQRATDLARRMVVEYGMSKRVGAINYAGPDAPNAFGIGPAQGAMNVGSAATAEVIEDEVRGILDRCHVRAREILRRNRVLLEEMSAHLLEKEVLDGETMQAFLARVEVADSLEDRPHTETEEIRQVGPV